VTWIKICLGLAADACSLRSARALQSQHRSTACSFSFYRL